MSEYRISRAVQVELMKECIDDASGLIAAEHPSQWLILAAAFFQYRVEQLDQKSIPTINEMNKKMLDK